MDDKENILDIPADKDKSGYIYILTNKSMEGLLKIGFTMRVDVEARCKELSSPTGVPTPYEIAYKKKSYFVIEIEDEKLIHSKLSDYHHGKEFFKVFLDKAISVVEEVLVASVLKKIKLLEHEKEVLVNSIEKKIESLDHEMGSLRDEAGTYKNRGVANQSTMDAMACITRGNSYHKEGDYDKAISEYTKAIEIYPQYDRAYYNLGVSYTKKGDYNRGIANYSKAAKLGFKLAQEILQSKGLDWTDGVTRKDKILQAAQSGSKPAQNWLRAKGYDW